MKQQTQGRAMIPVLLMIAASSWGCPNRSSENRPRQNRGDAGAQPESPSSAPSDGSPVASGGGQAVFPVSEFDFGDIEQGEKAEHVFNIRNEGREVLHIKNVRGS